MAVYKHSYQTYSGPITPIQRRWLVIARHSLAETFASRISVMLFVLCLVPIVIAATAIYIADSDAVRVVLNIRGVSSNVIDNRFFLKLLKLQGWFALFFTAWIGPVMVSPDLTNGALPLFLSRPISRAQYVLGKAAVLLVILSAVTWIPLLLLFGMHAQLAHGWLRDNLFIGAGMLVGSVVWIVLLTLLALAVSAWVRWRIVATGLVVALVIIPAGVGAVISGVLRTPWGLTLNIPYMVTMIWSHLLRAPMVFPRWQLPLSAAWIALLVVCGFCLLMLNKRVRARQVVRG